MSRHRPPYSRNTTKYLPNIFATATIVPLGVVKIVSACIRWIYRWTPLSRWCWSMRCNRLISVIRFICMARRSLCSAWVAHRMYSCNAWTYSMRWSWIGVVCWSVAFSSPRWRILWRCRIMVTPCCGFVQIIRVCGYSIAIFNFISQSAWIWCFRWARRTIGHQFQRDFHVAATICHRLRSGKVAWYVCRRISWNSLVIYKLFFSFFVEIYASCCIV